MFGKKQRDVPTGNIDCLIGAKTRIKGDIEFEGGLRVDGRVLGNLLGAPHSVLLISEQAVIEGEVRASQAVINGEIIGTVHIAERLELQAKARIAGDLHYHTLEMHPGAVIDGRLIHQSQADAEPVIALHVDNATTLKNKRHAA